ncbi:MAG: Na/Pi cotransporter family protein, partial [Paracoccus sp. (in: a-proteobacteria)]
MASILVFLQIAGSVALLLFGLGLVRDGVTTAFGLRLKTALGLGTRTGPRAFASGLVATLGLQSSTATALLTASFVDRRLIRGRMAQIVLLGANVGTAVTAWIVSAGIGAVAPGLVL